MAAAAASLTTQGVTESTTPQAEPQTPKGDPPSAWEERLDEGSGVKYYFNTEMNESVWERPAEMDWQQQQKFFPDGGIETPPLPEEEGTPEQHNSWDERYDEGSGVNYYFNTETQESVWEKVRRTYYVHHRTMADLDVRSGR